MSVFYKSFSKKTLEVKTAKMGASLVYLDEPNKDIEWDSGEDARVTFACGEMQGWRLNMVSHIIHCLLHNVIGDKSGNRRTNKEIVFLSIFSSLLSDTMNRHN